MTRRVKSVASISALAVTAAVVAVVVPWFERDDAPARADDPAAAPTPVGREEARPTAPVRRAAAAEAAAAADADRSRPAEGPGRVQPSDEERVAALTRQLAEDRYRRVGERMVADLVARGLAPSDGEATVRKALHDGAYCLFDALRRESEQSSISFVAVLDAMEAAMSDSDGPLVTALVDAAAVRQGAQPCMLDVAQRAGIPVP